jgi:hypothetical protein
MRIADSPQPGWYPDPDGGYRLRWWEGTDWTDHRRPAPLAGHLTEVTAEAEKTERLKSLPTGSGGRFAGTDADEIVTKARDAARGEVDRAAGEISREFHALIARVHEASFGYLSPILRWVRIGVVVAAVLVVVWFAIQFIAQATFLEWLGDRIDNITTESSISIDGR